MAPTTKKIPAPLETVSTLTGYRLVTRGDKDAKDPIIVSLSPNLDIGLFPKSLTVLQSCDPERPLAAVRYARTEKLILLIPESAEHGDSEAISYNKARDRGRVDASMAIDHSEFGEPIQYTYHLRAWKQPLENDGMCLAVDLSTMKISPYSRKVAKKEKEKDGETKPAEGKPSGTAAKDAAAQAKDQAAAAKQPPDQQTPPK